MKKEYYTKETYDKLKKELENLKQRKKLSKLTK